MPKHFSQDTRTAVVTYATEEVRRRGDRRLGTDHLLLGLLHEPTSAAAMALGVSLDSARAAADDLDRAALAAIGIDVGALSAAAVATPGRRVSSFTSGAREVIAGALEETRQAKSRQIETTHLLLALLGRNRPDPGAELLHALEVDTAAVRQRLADLSKAA